MEGFVLKSLTSEVAHKLDLKQFALSTKSTTHALVYFLHLILSALDRGQCSVRIFFADFKKGFDLVDHNVVIDELQKLQVNPAITRWIKSFLSCREQSVKIGLLLPRRSEPMVVCLKGPNLDPFFLRFW